MLAAVAAATLGASGASAAVLPPTTEGEIKLTSAFAKPISAQEPQCNPEPGGQRIYGTEDPFRSNAVETGSELIINGFPASVNSGEYNQPQHPNYYAPNRRSRDTMVPVLDAAANNDLCFGFTLTPNLEPGFQALTNPDNTGQYNRYQADPRLPDVRQTHVIAGEDNDDLKSATIDMPAGFAGAPDATPKCSDADFGIGNYLPVQCPGGTQTGTLYARVSVLTPNGLRLHIGVGGLSNPLNLDPPDPFQEPGAVYNLTPGPGELARLGAFVQVVGGIAPAKFVVRLVLSPEGRVQAITETAPRHVYDGNDVQGYPTATPAPYEDRTNLPPGKGQLVPGATKGQIYLEAFSIRAWGAAGTGNHPTLTKPFVEWGTNCTDDLSAKVSVETYAGTKSSISSDPFKLTGCENLPFAPSLSIATTEKRAGVPTGATIKVGIGQTTTGPKSATLRDATVTLPAGLELGAQVASGAKGLGLCTAAQFDKATTGPAACPESSRAGDVNIVTPLLSKPLKGSVYLGPQAAVGELPALYLEATLDGSTAAGAARIKIIGSTAVDAEGRLTTKFKDAPELRFSELELTFPGGDNALFTTPRTCGTTTGQAAFTSWASPTAVNIESPLTIDEGCDAPGFAPTLSMTPSNAQVGAKSPTNVTISREDRSPWLTGVKVSLPTGFLSDLTAASECPASAAATGACDDSSRIATVTTVAGVGPKPLSLKGKMYLAEREPGSVAGAVIVVRAKIGELDLGDVVVPGKIDLRPNDAGLVLTTTAPTRFRGLALNLRSIIVDLDRENFPLNPTACGPLRATAELTGEGGATAAPTADVTYTGCGDLPFQPGITAALTGDTGPAKHPGMSVVITPRPGDSNLKSSTVTLPMGVSTDPKNLKSQCDPAVFAAGGCGADTQVGTVEAKVSITNETVTGTVHLVRSATSAVPGLGMNITGRYALRVLSSVTIVKDNRVKADFASIPDLPLRRLELTVAGGDRSPLQVSPKACTQDSAYDAVFVGQGGKTHNVAIPVKCKTPPVVAQSVSWSRKSGLKFTLTAPTGKTLKSAKLTLPKGFKLASKKSVRKKYAKAKVSGGKAKVKLTSTSLSIVGTGAGPTKVTFTVGTKGYVLPKSYKKKLKKGAKIKLKTRIVVNGETTATSKTVTVKTK